MEEFKIIKEYLEERIRIDSLPEGFTKAYDEATIKHQNIKILGLLSNLERALAEPSSVLQANELLPHVSNSVCPECEGEGYHFFINQGEPDTDSICKKCKGSGQIAL